MALISVSHRKDMLRVQNPGTFVHCPFKCAWIEFTSQENSKIHLQSWQPNEYEKAMRKQWFGHEQGLNLMEQSAVG